MEPILLSSEAEKQTRVWKEEEEEKGKTEELTINTNLRFYLKAEKVLKQSIHSPQEEIIYKLYENITLRKAMKIKGKRIKIIDKLSVEKEEKQTVGIVIQAIEEESAQDGISTCLVRIPSHDVVEPTVEIDRLPAINMYEELGYSLFLHGEDNTFMIKELKK